MLGLKLMHVSKMGSWNLILLYLIFLSYMLRYTLALSQYCHVQLEHQHDRKNKYIHVLSEKQITMKRVNRSPWSSDAIWHHITLSVLVHAIACCLTAPSYYLNQCWLIIKCGFNLRAFSQDVLMNLIHNMFRHYIFKMTNKSPRGQWVNHKT